MLSNIAMDYHTSWSSTKQGIMKIIYRKNFEIQAGSRNLQVCYIMSHVITQSYLQRLRDAGDMSTDNQP